MKRLASWLLIGSLISCLAACDVPRVKSPPAVSDEYLEKSTFGDAALLLQELNDHLDPSVQCDIHRPRLTTGYAKRVPNRDAAACRFSDRTPLFALIVEDGEKTYKRHFGRQFGPNNYLRGDDWFIIAPLGVPRQALDILRAEFGAAG